MVATQFGLLFLDFLSQLSGGLVDLSFSYFLPFLFFKILYPHYFDIWWWFFHAALHIRSAGQTTAAEGIQEAYWKHDDCSSRSRFRWSWGKWEQAGSWLRWLQPWRWRHPLRVAISIIHASLSSLFVSPLFSLSLPPVACISPSLSLHYVCLYLSPSLPVSLFLCLLCLCQINNYYSRSFTGTNRGLCLKNLSF